jgi:hypothetical protein
MKTFLKSRFFWTRLLPVVFFCIATIVVLCPYSRFKVIFGTALLFFPLLNLFLQRKWMSCILGTFYCLFAAYLLFASITEYKELITTNTEPELEKFYGVVTIQEGLSVLIRWIVWSFSVTLMGILLCLPFRQKHS